MTKLDLIKTKVPFIASGTLFDADVDKVGPRPDPNVETPGRYQLCLFVWMATKDVKDFKKVVIGDGQFFGVEEPGHNALVQAGLAYDQGLTTKAIAERLNLSSKTVDVHREHIKEKLQLENATSLIRYAVRWVESQDSSVSPSDT